MYKIIKSDFKGFENDMAVSRVELVVDSAAEIPEPLDSWTIGSLALCADTQDILVLNINREWV